MSLIYTHDNKTEITGLTKDGNYHIIDLSSYVQSGCLGVLLQFVNDSPGTAKEAGYMTVGSSTNRDINLYAKSHKLLLCKLDGSYQAQIKCEDSNVSVYIQTEFFEGMVLQDSDDWVVQPGYVVSDWVTVTVHPMGDDTYVDIEAVLVYGVKTGGTQQFGARALGATTETQALIQSQIFALPVKTNVNGQYQVYIPSAGCGPPTVSAREIGYIKKGYGFKAIFEPEELFPAYNTDWETLRLNNIIDSYSTHAVVRLVINSAVTGTDTCGVRAKGSTNPADSLRNAVWVIYWPSVDSIRELEYRHQGNATVDVLFDTLGYVEDPAGQNIVDIYSGTKNMVSGEVNIQS